jgi:hypothetical protein
MDIAVLAQLLSSLGTLIVASGILYQGRQARKARDDTDRPQIIVDADYTGRFTTNVVVRNIGNGTAKNITFEFSAPLESTSGHDITELPYFKHGINFMAPQTDLPAVWDSFQNVVENLREKGLTEGITITSHYEDRNGEPYQTAWTINPCCSKAAGTRTTRATRTRCRPCKTKPGPLRRSRKTSKNSSRRWSTLPTDGWGRRMRRMLGEYGPKVSLPKLPRTP